MDATKALTDFVGFPREAIVTEKIDGTNGFKRTIKNNNEPKSAQ